MKIYINEEIYNVFPYDDGSSILQFYSLEKKNTLPEYLRITDPDFYVKENADCIIKDIRDEFRWVTLQDLLDIDVITEIGKLFPYLARKDVAILVLLN